MRKNTQKFYDTIREYQTARYEVEQAYSRAVESAQPYKGSPYFDTTMREAKAARDAGIKAEKETAVAAMRKIFADMKDAAKNRPFVAPTQDVVNVLQVLKLMPDPDRDAYTAAEAFLKDSPFALRALDQMAAEHNIHLAGAREPSTKSILETVNIMERNFFTALNDSSSSLHNYLPPDAETCLARFAGISYTGSTSGTATINAAAIEAISNAINGPEAEG